jgi:hypothetical protein
MNNPIVFLLGAGASFPYGVPMMAEFYTEFRTYLQRRHPQCMNLLERLEQQGNHVRPDLETLLSDLSSVLNVDQALQLIGMDTTLVAADIENARELRGYLDAFIIDRCERFDREKSALEVQSLLALREIAPLWVFTTNYDRILELACDSQGISWADGFEVGSVNPVSDWIADFQADVRIVKLHGSVNWYVDDPGGAIHRLDRGYSLPGQDFRLLRKDQRLRPLMIIPTLEKQALSEPYIGLSLRFTDVLKDAKLLIIAGSSLRDTHIKSYIQNRLTNLQVLLVDPAAERNLKVFQQQERVHALNAGFSEFLTLGGQALLKLGRDISGIMHSDDIVKQVDQFIAEVSRDIDDNVTISADPNLARLWKSLKALSLPVRVAAIEGLCAYTHPAVTRHLVSILRSDVDPHVRVAAVDAVTKISGTGAIAILGEALKSDTSLEVRIEAALALIRLGCVGELRDLFQHSLVVNDIPPTLRAIIEEGLESKAN